MNNKKLIILAVLCLSLMIFMGCSKTSVDNVVDNDSSATDTDANNTKEYAPLKIGLMPAVDSAPMFVAEKEGYFTELGLDVEFVIFNNGQDRQTALQTGAIDGAMTDFIAVATNVSGGFDIKATTMTSGKFPILVRTGFEESSDIKVGMMEVSVSNFLVDEWLSERYNIEKVFINEIPARLEMIKAGNLDMGLFPEPLASMGELSGLEKRIYEPKDGYCPDVMVFTGSSIKEKSDSIKAFHIAYNKAIDKINSDDSIAREILIETLKLKPEIKDMIELPSYTHAALPSDEYLSNIITWVEDVLNKEMDIQPSDMVEGMFVK